MDLKVANWIFKTFGSNEVIQKLANILTYIGDEITIISVILMLLVFKKTRKIGIYAGITVLISFLTGHFILKPIISRERPFVINPEFLSALELSNVKMPDSNSMPSGHSLVSMSLAVAVFIHNKRFGFIAISLSVICGLTRLVLCVHFLSDVLVGFIIGILFAIGIYYLINFITKKYLKRKGFYNEKNSSSNNK